MFEFNVEMVRKHSFEVNGAVYAMDILNYENNKILRKFLLLGVNAFLGIYEIDYEENEEVYSGIKFMDKAS